MNNEQVALKKSKNIAYLSVHSIFHTIQGEGIFSGNAAIFIRLFGCNLQCTGCDTDYTSKNTIVSAQELISKIIEIRKNTNCNLIIITGGEPLRQEIALTEFIKKSVDSGFIIQIETNGTYPLSGIRKSVNHENLYICVSPKISSIKKDIYNNSSFLKIVVPFDESRGILGLGFMPEIDLSELKSPLFIHPEDMHNEELNKQSIQKALNYFLKLNANPLSIGKDIRFGLQIHKYIGVE